MTAIESPVTITTSTGATSARCVCGWGVQILRFTDPTGVTAHAKAMDAWAHHWHDTHTEGDNE